MKRAPLPSNELERLKALYKYEILDTEAEKAFDDLTLLASQICETPIALISLLDPDRQWFKSKVGLDAEQTSRDIAFCDHAIHLSEVFEVNNALEDERFFDNPLVTGGPEIRFYAGAQLMTPEGYAIGTLCAIDTKPHKLNEQQRKALEILSREVISQLELRCKIKQLERIDQHKTDFLSNISHELRTPLNAIVNFSKLMLSQLTPGSHSDKLREYATYVDTASKHLLSLVNSVLDMSKIEQGKLELVASEVNIGQMFEQLHGVMSVQAEAKSIHLTDHLAQNMPQSVLMDESKVKQIVLNLVGNAIKFTPEGGKVDVYASVEKDQLHIQVKDNGCGISKQDQQQLFDKYQQVGKDKGSEGTGLGLTITKGLVEFMGGQITLKSEEGIGTTLDVNFPIELVEIVPSNGDSCDVRLAAECDLKVLLVEDTPINQQVAIAIFNSIGLSIDLAETGEQSIEMADNKGYDIIFMDLHLPGIDGDEAALAIGQKHPDIPIVVLTADVFFDDEKGAKVFKDMLIKPLETEKLVQVINRCVIK